MIKINKYFAIFLISVRYSLKNYYALIGLSIFLITCLVIFSNLWKIAAAKAGALSLDPSNLLWYIALNEWILISVPDIHEDMEEDLRSGRLAYLLPRPISYLGATFAEAMGSLSVNLTVLGIVSIAFAWISTGMLSFPPAAIGLFILFGLLAGILTVLFYLLIGLSSFWLKDIAPVQWIWEKLLLLLGGLMLPLTVYPQWLQSLGSLTPFPVILGWRSALAIEFDLDSVVSLAFWTIFWIGLANAIILYTYRKALRILNIEGG